MPVGVDYRTSADTLGLPLDLPRRELDCDQSLCRRAVKIVANEYRSAYAVRQSAREVDLLGDNSAAVWLQADKPASDLVRPAVHVFAARDRRYHLCHPLGCLLVAPEELTRLCINPNYALAQKLHVLLAASRLHDDR